MRFFFDRCMHYKAGPREEWDAGVDLTRLGGE